MEGLHRVVFWHAVYGSSHLGLKASDNATFWTCGKKKEISICSLNLAIKRKISTCSKLSLSLEIKLLLDLIKASFVTPTLSFLFFNLNDYFEGNGLDSRYNRSRYQYGSRFVICICLITVIKNPWAIFATL